MHAGVSTQLAEERRAREAAEARLGAAQARVQEAEAARQQAQRAQQAAERERDAARQALQLAEAAAQQQAAPAAAAAAAQQAQAAAEARAAASEARAQAAEAALRRATATVPSLSLGARLLAEFSLRYVGPPHADAAPRAAVLWSLADDGAASPSSLEAAMVMRLWRRGGRRRGAVRGYELTRIEAAQTDPELQTTFLREAKVMNDRRQNGPPGVFSPPLNRPRDDPDGEKAAVLDQLKEELLPLEGLPRCGVVLGLHGTSHDNAANLFRGGFAQINSDDDNGTSHAA